MTRKQTIAETRPSWAENIVWRETEEAAWRPLLGERCIYNQRVSVGLLYESFGEIPKECKSNHHHDGKQSNTPMLGFLEHLHQTVQECSKPEEPLQERRYHHSAHDRYVDNLNV